MTKWIDVDDQLPPAKNDEFSIFVLCYLEENMIISGEYDLKSQQWYDFNGDLIDEVYYWMMITGEPA
jgi:hypothetical protein